jgi:hypothetical protein
MSEATYLWLIFWQDVVIKPQRVEIRQVTRLPDVTDSDLERHLLDVAFPDQGKETTRDGGVDWQLLLKLTGERTTAIAYVNPAQGVATPLGAYAVATGLSADVVWASDKNPMQARPE